MNTLRNSRVLAVFGALAVMLAVAVVAAPSAEAGYGYNPDYTPGYSSYYPPVATHYVAPVYPSYAYYPTYPTYPNYPTYPTHPGCGLHW